jgi:hypothetical protein
MKRFRRWLLSGIGTLSTLGVFIAFVHHRQPIPTLTINNLCFSLTTAAQTNVSIPPSIEDVRSAGL